ncbi:cytochrome P450 [Multifurca ochricompacta]|uniref:Cytochrome P450 n=1 Tax=Multifurca ochricompacta TaxID=376703 RepID=A0AAD4M2E4_9AGAM|nr:cytochrome P450 [Multifurca ochricompacta]
MFAPEALYISVAILTVAFLIRRRRRASSLPLPPGPRGWPLIDNLFDWPFESAWIPFAAWSKVFGDIIHLKIFGLHIVIISSYDTATSLMTQASYSDRPILTMVGKLMNFTPSIVLAPYGDHWKSMRRITQQSLNRSSSLAFLPSQLGDARLLLQELLVHPENYIGAIRYALGKNIIENTYGIRITSPSSEYVKLSRETHEVIQNAVVPGSFFVDVFPALRFIPEWFPGAGFKRLARIAKARGEHMVDGAFDAAKKAMASEDSMVSLVGNLLSSEGPKEMTREEYEYTIKWAAGSLYGAPPDLPYLICSSKTTSGIATFLLTMVLFPDVQKKVQAELDAVVGRKRLPTFEDRASLPYLEATIKESLRFHPPTPLGIAHRLIEDDVVQGYHIPKGAIILPNIWAMNMNEKQYEHPERFNPERYLGPSPALESPVFGFGRRACLGVHYSTAAIFITVASILSVFDLRAQDKDGKDVEIEPAFTGGKQMMVTCLSNRQTELTIPPFPPHSRSHPKPFPCRLISRSPESIELIKAGTSML